jgi:hypothetical protein
MAVEIPVVIDIDKAFEDAAKSVDSAIKPLQRKISANTLKLKIQIGVDDEGHAVTTTFKKIKDGSIHELSTLQNAISSVKMAMISAAEAGDKAKFTSLLEAKTYLEDMVRASEVLRLDMDGIAKTMAGLNARMSAARETFANTRINSADWRAAAREIQKVTAEMDKAQRKVAEMGTKAGSIDRLNMKISELRDKWNAMSRAQKFDADGNLKASARRVVEQYKKVSEEAAKFGQSLEATARGANNETKKLEKNVRNVNRELEQSESKLAMLVKNSLRLLAIHSAGTFVRNIREVTSEFELQRVALASIIQDTEKAESLFKQIKAAAVESPFQIKELVTYTKQLSAYQIETEKLFDTTQKLADISAGLGVDMGRLILAFGQVRAAAVLRGQELRQFTEAGIPLVERLADKFTELNGRIVSTSEVFELISKRAVPFAMIEEIFNDLTSAGGAFYQMQEKQAETLLGQWNNLKDSISIMYDEIGNTKAVHSAMEGLISDAKKIMQNWRSVATIIKFVGTQYVFLKIASAFLPTLTYNTKMLEKAELAEARAKQLSNAAHRSGNKILDMSAKSTKAYALYTLKAARSATQFGRAINGIKAFLSGNWVAILISALTLLAAKFVAARKEANRLNEELSKIEGEGVTKIEQSIRNFSRLADAAVKSIDGTKEQREAVDELVRTYGDLLPPADKVVDKLREMNGEYKDLTDAIRHKIDLQIQEQKVEEILSEFGTKIGGKRDSLKKILKEQGFTSAEVSGIMSEVESAVKEGLVSTEMDVAAQAKAIEGIIKDYTGKYIKLTESAYASVAGTNQKVYQGERSTKLSRTFSDLIKLFGDMNGKIQEVEESMEDGGGVLGKYAKEWKDLKEEISQMPMTGDTRFEQNESKIENYVSKAVSFMEEKFRAAEIDVSGAFDANKIDFDVLTQLVENIKDKEAQASMRTIIKDFKKEYDKLVPDDVIVDLVKSKFKEISENTGISLDKFTSYVKKAGDDNKEYIENLGDSIKKFRDDAESLQEAMKIFPESDTERNRKKVKEYTDMANSLQIVYDLLVGIINLNTSGGGTYKQDPFIKNMQDRIKFMQDFKKGYDSLNKYMTSSGALARQFDIMQSRGLSIGIDPAEQKRAAGELSAWYEDAINEAFEEAKKHGASGSITAFMSKQIEDNTNRGKMLKSFQDLIHSLWDAKTDFDTSQLKKDLEDALKRVTEEVKRSDTARNLFQNILDLTGDEEVSRSITLSVYGEPGVDFKGSLQKQLDAAFMSLDWSELPDDIWGQLSTAIASQDFDTIIGYIGLFPTAWQDAIKQMKADNEKFNASWVSDILKTYQKTKSFEERMTDVRKREEQKRKEIAESKTLGDEEKAALIAASNRKEAEDIASIQVEALKATYEWTKAFEDLDRVGNKTLTGLRDKIVALIEAESGNLTAEELKTLRQELEKINDVLAERDPFSAIVSGGNRMLLIMRAMKQSKGTEAYSEAIAKIKQFNETAKDSDKIDIDHLEDSFRDANKDLEKGISGVADYLSAWKSVVDTVSDAFNLDEVPVLGETLEGVSDALSFVASILPVIITLNGILNGTLMMNPIIAAGAGIVAIVGAIVGLVKGLVNAKVERLNKKIEEQEKLIDSLERSYDRLDSAIEKAFGSDYIYNYTKQLEILAAKQAAYEEQARLESEKGKKADKDKIEDYTNAARDAEDAIADMKGQLAEFFTDTDVTSAATEFATAWIDAYKEFGSTTDAMKEKFNDMVQSMITKSLAAKIMQSVLQPLFDQIDEMAQSGGELSAQEIAQIANLAPEYINQISDAMNSLMAQMSAAGYNLRQRVGGFTGIKRDIANASEESINGLATGINTQNFYMQLISQNVAAILAVLTGSAEVSGPAGAAAVTDPYKDQMLQYVSALPQMRDDIAAMRSMWEKVIRPNGTSATHYVSTR